MITPEAEQTKENKKHLQRESNDRLCSEENDLSAQQRRFSSLRNSRGSISEGVEDHNRLHVPCNSRTSSSSSSLFEKSIDHYGIKPLRLARHSAPAIDAPAPEYLARSLLQLGCPAVSMLTPRGGVNQEQHTQNSDSDDPNTTHNRHGQGQRSGCGQGHVDSYAVPKVRVSSPPNSPESISVFNGQLSKPLSRSTPSMAAGGSTQTPGKVSGSSSRSSPSACSARQKKFHRHFTESSKFRGQVPSDERVLNYYSCALVGDILLQGHLYITPNYFAFYSNVFGYVTKLLIPTTSVLRISKEKTARIIPNAVAIATEDNRHVFCSLLSRDSTFKLMKQVWDAAMEPRHVPDMLPLPDEAKLTPEPLVVDDSEINPEEEESSMSESGTDLTSRPPTVCTDTTDIAPPPSVLPKPIIPPLRVDAPALPNSTASTGIMSTFNSFLTDGLKPSTVITILVALLVALYVSAALMMFRIDRLHTAYLNHPLVSPERFTQERLLHYLNTNLDQIVKVRQSLQTLSQQFVAMSRGSQGGASMSGGAMDPEDAPS